MFDWTTSIWFLTLLVTVLAISVSAGVTRFYYRRTGKNEPGAARLYYNLATGLMTLLAFVFIARWLVELIR